ncbi:hypothetical protein [Nostoc sphaeroides]|uniref:DNA-binding protein n=1 Tax=Nostoc sphaeroides CCNUC1 TaxID=2653204 RepID=A0A5P8WGX4_9NOSO|nr:hypothetical protein [Nostoc sphaeroides]QFS51772.1 DNA-binding protein [Nostoc sphaeroides CCNUC1]
MSLQELKEQAFKLSVSDRLALVSAIIAVQVGCALAEGLDAIVTRDADFASTLIPISSVIEILQQLESP